MSDTVSMDDERKRRVRAGDEAKVTAYYQRLANKGEDASTFTSVAGQRVWAQRPPKGYFVLIDTDGKALVIHRAVLESSPEAVLSAIESFAGDEVDGSEGASPRMNEREKGSVALFWVESSWGASFVRAVDEQRAKDLAAAEFTSDLHGVGPEDVLDRMWVERVPPVDGPEGVVAESEASAQKENRDAAH